MKIIVHFIIPAMILAGGFLSFTMLARPIQELDKNSDALIEKLERINIEHPIVAKQCRIDYLLSSEENLKSFAARYRMALLNMLIIVVALFMGSIIREMYLYKNRKNS